MTQEITPRLKDRLLDFIVNNYDRKQYLEQREGPERDPPQDRDSLIFLITQVKTYRICEHFNITMDSLIEELSPKPESEKLMGCGMFISDDRETIIYKTDSINYTLETRISTIDGTSNDPIK